MPPPDHDIATSGLPLGRNQFTARLSCSAKAIQKCMTCCTPRGLYTVLATSWACCQHQRALDMVTSFFSCFPTSQAPVQQA